MGTGTNIQSCTRRLPLSPVTYLAHRLIQSLCSLSVQAKRLDFLCARLRTANNEAYSEPAHPRLERCTVLSPALTGHRVLIQPLGLLPEHRISSDDWHRPIGRPHCCWQRASLVSCRSGVEGPDKLEGGGLGWTPISERVKVNFGPKRDKKGSRDGIK